jgi:hypothetical protein
MLTHNSQTSTETSRKTISQQTDIKPRKPIKHCAQEWIAGHSQLFSVAHKQQMPKTEQDLNSTRQKTIFDSIYDPKEQKDNDKEEKSEEEQKI